VLEKRIDRRIQQVGFQNRGYRDRQRPRTSACQCRAESVTFTDYPKIEAGIHCKTLETLPERTAKVVLSGTHLVDGWIFRFIHRKRQPGNCPKVYREPRVVSYPVPENP
jgi:hypothetical protein